MNAIVKRFCFSGLLITVLFMFGCAPMLEMAITGAGSAAIVEPINFFKTTDNLVSIKNSGEDLSDFYYIAPNVDWTKYKKVIVNDFTSITPNIQKNSGLQIPNYKNLKKDIPDNIANTFDGSIFSQCSRSAERIDHSDINGIKNVQADAILFGNISEMKAMGQGRGGGVGLAAAQVEIKLVDTKTGEEILKMINRSTTDGDKLSMPINRRLANLINKAKGSKQ